jgi:phosphatidate cytidylyltransferase
MADLTKRIAVAFIGIPTIVILTYLGGWYFFLMLVVISSAAQWEFYNMHKKESVKPQVLKGLIGGFFILLGVQTGAWFIIGGILLILLMIIIANEMFLHHENGAINIGITLAGILYVPLFLGTLMFSRLHFDNTLPDIAFAGFKIIMILLVAIWICDTFAYGVGVRFGKHKLNEKVSPNKTIEGAVAGLAGAIGTLLIVKILHIFPLDWIGAILIGSVVGVIGQIGDLVESWFKRNAGVKDSSNLLPGHGGMLDRFDSLIFLSPALLILTILYF